MFQASSSIDHYVTEIILNMCATDVILPLAVIEKFLSVLKPLINVCQKSFDDDLRHPGVSKDVDAAFSCLPIVYFDVPTLRVFIPISTHPTGDAAPLCDTLVFEVGTPKILSI